MTTQEHNQHRITPLPELLAPAGSPEALEAALAAGADAVYLGGSAFNARMNAHNFDRYQLEAAVTLAHRVGARVYLTLNTMVYDRERAAALDAAYEAAVCGVDGLIIADVGMASLIHRALPHLPLHASTQFSGHSYRVGEFLAPKGFSRYVTARESSLSDLREAVEKSGLEVEVFIHGALCVSHSGQCLFSSLVGGRSGNRGECAQPCRLPYGCKGCGSTGKKKEEYPLSLKDLSLARHVPTLIDVGVASLKIEGRMKSPAYVGGVVSIWRRLLDERRGATDDEMAQLSDLFSRGGFTDGYLTERMTHSMMGVRSDEDKSLTRQAEKASLGKAVPRLDTAMLVTAKANEPLTLTITAPLFRQNSAPTVTCTVTGDIPDVARNSAAALTRETLERQLSRTGGTAYRVTSLETHMEGELILPMSKLNALRREAVEALDTARMVAMPRPDADYDPTVKETATPRPAAATPSAVIRTARFHRPQQITEAAQDFFDILYLPLQHFEAGEKRGVILPPVIFDREHDQALALLVNAIKQGARHILVGNVGHLPLIREAAAAADLPAESLTVHGDFRLNVGNATTTETLLGAGFEDLILSPELTLPRLRDVADAQPTRTAAIVYGRIPLMLLEKCAIRELYATPADHKAPMGRAGEACRICAKDAAVLVDRKGISFPILREWEHRNTVYNSFPISMTDREEELRRAHITHEHYIFSTETATDVNHVLSAVKRGAPLGGDVRRMTR